MSAASTRRIAFSRPACWYSSSAILDDTLLARLDAHLAEERAAAERGDRAASVRLSGAFHIHLVDALGNPDLSRFLRDLLSRSSVMVSVYEPATQSICAVDEHGAIVDALRARDVTRAIEFRASTSCMWKAGCALITKRRP